MNSGTCLDTNSSVSATLLEFLDTIDSDDNNDDVSSVHVHTVFSNCKHQPKEGKDLICCSRCQITRYCSIQCQEKDWANFHRFGCGQAVGPCESLNSLPQEPVYIGSFKTDFTIFLLLTCIDFIILTVIQIVF